MRVLLLFLCSFALQAADTASAIRAVLDAQVQAWNQGDLQAFMKGYKQSPDITFTGKAVTRGFDAVLQRYLNTYGNREKMGTLRFDEIEIRLLGKTHALVLGRFHLTRNAAGGGDANGRFSLVAEWTKHGWKFIHDHTS